MSKEKQSSKDTRATKDAKFYAAVLQSSGDFGVEEFDTLEALVERLKELVDKDVSVFSFAGSMLRVSKPPFRHLLTPWGPQPLFTVQAEDFEVDETGYLGIDPIHLTDPPVIKTPKGATAFADNSDEFFDSNDDQSIGVFDNILPDPDS